MSDLGMTKREAIQSLAESLDAWPGPDDCDPKAPRGWRWVQESPKSLPELHRVNDAGEIHWPDWWFHSLQIQKRADKRRAA